MDIMLDESYMTSVEIYASGSVYDGKPDLADDEFVKVLKGEDRWSSQESKDHPEFAKLREQLGKQGYIKIERSWWNGDIVLKPFTLNGVRFKKNEQFSCASAMGFHLKHAKKIKGR
jgi:hypothetical protein